MFFAARRMYSDDHVVVAVEFAPTLVARKPAVRITIHTRLMSTLRAGLQRECQVHLFDTDTVLDGLVSEHLLQFAKRPVVQLSLGAVVFAVHSVADVGQPSNSNVRTVVGPHFFANPVRWGLITQ